MCLSVIESTLSRVKMITKNICLKWIFVLTGPNILPFQCLKSSPTTLASTTCSPLAYNSHNDCKYPVLLKLQLPLNSLNWFTKESESRIMTSLTNFTLQMTTNAVAHARFHFSFKFNCANDEFAVILSGEDSRSFHSSDLLLHCFKLTYILNTFLKLFQLLHNSSIIHFAMNSIFVRNYKLIL